MVESLGPFKFVDQLVDVGGDFFVQGSSSTTMLIWPYDSWDAGDIAAWPQGILFVGQTSGAQFFNGNSPLVDWSGCVASTLIQYYSEYAAIEGPDPDTCSASFTEYFRTQLDISGTSTTGRINLNHLNKGSNYWTSILGFQNGEDIKIFK